MKLRLLRDSLLRMFLPDTSYEFFFDKMSSKPKCWFILFFIFPSMKVANSIRCAITVSEGVLCTNMSSGKQQNVPAWLHLGQRPTDIWELIPGVIFVKHSESFAWLVHARHVPEWAAPMPLIARAELICVGITGSG